MLKSTFFQGVAVSIIDAEGPTVLDGLVVVVTSDGGPIRINLD